LVWIGKIGALVLTYNRKDILVQCLNAILTQVEPADEIIVLDNGSTDGTCEYLQKSGILKHDCIVLYRFQDNTAHLLALIRFSVSLCNAGAIGYGIWMTTP
jgi:glycosyltransferase involved in cell wall biosynthesis